MHLALLGLALSLGSAPCAAQEVEILWSSAKRGAFRLLLRTDGDVSEVREEGWGGALQLALTQTTDCHLELAIRSRVGARVEGLERLRVAAGQELRVAAGSIRAGTQVFRVASSKKASP